MRVGIDITSCLNPRGYGRFSRGLIGALLTRVSRHDFILLSDSQTAAQVELPASDAEWVVVPTSEAAVDAASHSSRRSFGSMRSFGTTVSRLHLDAIFFPTVYTYFPVLSRLRVIVGFHDVIPEDYPELVFPERRRRLLWNLKSRLARFQADFIMTVSEHSKKGLQRHFGLPSERVWVVGEAPDPVFRRLAPAEMDHSLLERYGVATGARFLIYVGGINPHKNLESVLDALARLVQREDLADTSLLIVGETTTERFTPGFQKLKDKIADMSLEDRVHFTGYVPDTDVVHLLNLARLLVLPSLAEGYGLPAVEAAACGTPVIATTNSPLPDILAGGGLFVDPGKPEELVTALERVLSDEELRRELGMKALQKASSLSWERSATQMDELLTAVEGTSR